MIRYQCAKCGSQLESPDSLAACDDKCPSCGARNVVPTLPVSEAPPRSSKPKPVQAQPPRAPVINRSNLVLAFLLLAILAILVYPNASEYMRERASKNTASSYSGNIMFVEVKRSIGGWDQPYVPVGWEVKAAFYRPLTEYEVGLPGQQMYVLVLQKK